MATMFDKHGHVIVLQSSELRACCNSLNRAICEEAERRAATKKSLCGEDREYQRAGAMSDRLAVIAEYIKNQS
jgi:hypothetical protein